MNFCSILEKVLGPQLNSTRLLDLVVIKLKVPRGFSRKFPFPCRHSDSPGAMAACRRGRAAPCALPDPPFPMKYLLTHLQ